MNHGGLAEVTCQRIDAHRIAVRIGNHRLLDIMDSRDGPVTVHKNSGSNDTVYANPEDLLKKILTALQKIAG